MIQQQISKAIKSSCWLAIEYENAENSKTKYWIAIKDIDIEKRCFSVDAFNFTKMDSNSNGIITLNHLPFDRIASAYVVENTSYEQPSELIEKINKNIEKLEWLSYDLFNNDVLDYIHEAMKHEEVPYHSELTLVRGIDHDALKEIPENKKYNLSLEQISDLVPKLEKLSDNDSKKKYESVKLALNLLSIYNKDRGNFVVAFKELIFNPIERALVLSPNTIFNYEFTSTEFKDFKHNLRNYLDIETDDFTTIFLEDPKKAKDMLMGEINRPTESIDDRPYIFELRRAYYQHIEDEINGIKKSHKENNLQTPMQAFFGNMSKDKIRRTRHVDVVVLDDKANIDQLRVIYNSLVQPITYVQGPPGTGKTQTIINTLISALFNNQTVLVSSNNNKPITDIYNKLMNLKSRNMLIPLPFLRLGNNEEVLKTLNHLKIISEKYSRFESDDKKLNIHATNKREKMKKVNEIIGNHEKRLELEEEINALSSMKSAVTSELRTQVIISELLDRKQKEFDSLSFTSEEKINQYVTKADSSFMSWLFFTSIKYIQKMREPKNKELMNIINCDDDKEKVKQFNKYTKNTENFKKLLKIFPIILTTNQSAHRLGEQEAYFDLCIMDEAGQCSIGASLFPITRSKRLLLVGDQNQLKPVLSISPETNKVLLKKFKVDGSYDYLKNSILLTMQKRDTISKFVLLRYHYRSRKDIINFSNKKYYNGQLKLPKDESYKTKALEMINVDTSKTTKQAQKNISALEINAIINSIKNSKESSIGVITPFRNQAHLLKETLTEAGLGHIDVGTVHTFQGDEKDVIYFSSGITKQTFDKTFEWVKNNQELINVATTRAKNKFVLVADYDEIETRSKVTNDFHELTQYVKKNGREIELKPTDNVSFINGYNFKSFNSEKEKEFLTTINHLLSFGDKYKLQSKVRVASILDNFTNPVKHDYGLKAEFDLVIFQLLNNLEIPVVAIEFDGDEHNKDQATQRRDSLKEQIAKDNNLKIIRIGNDYSRRYMYIKEILAETLIY